jgi:polyvinyl alcohol dehydrogenase (cytochrome)
MIHLRRFSVRAVFLLLAFCIPSFACDTPFRPETGSQWNGWGAGLTNSRYQEDPGIKAEQVPSLKLKWAFGFPGTRSVIGQPSLVGGRVFIGVDTGHVYAIDSADGCLAWDYTARAGVRTAITVARVEGTRFAAFFGDLSGMVYAVDANTGVELWKTRADTHPAARITGAPQFFENRLYVPIASGEEGAGGGANYACCTFRGSVVALSAQNGSVIWKTYVIEEEPRPRGATAGGTARMGPSGAGIWSAPTIDAKRRSIYVGTGDAYSEPADKATDAIVALDLDSGKIRWIAQDTANDVWISACMRPNKPENCGPDHDFGSPPMLKTLTDGRDVLVAGQKSGNVWAHDPATGKVLWRSPLVANTEEFGGKIVWGGASNFDTAYFGLGPGGIGAVQLRDGKRAWLTEITPVAGMEMHPGHEGPLTLIPGVVFSGGWDGMVRALNTSTGKIVWSFNTAREFETNNHVPAKGGSMGAAGPVAAGGMLLVPSGYIGVRNGVGGNVLLAFSVSQ